MNGSLPRPPMTAEQLILPGWTPLIGWPASSAQLLQFLLERKRRAQKEPTNE